jgi:hypothetical protein
VLLSGKRTSRRLVERPGQVIKSRPGRFLQPPRRARNKCPRLPLVRLLFCSFLSARNPRNRNPREKAYNAYDNAQEDDASPAHHVGSLLKAPVTDKEKSEHKEEESRNEILPYGQYRDLLVIAYSPVRLIDRSRDLHVSMLAVYNQLHLYPITGIEGVGFQSADICKVFLFTRSGDLSLTQLMYVSGGNCRDSGINDLACASNGDTQRFENLRSPYPSAACVLEAKHGQSWPGERVSICTPTYLQTCS